MRWVARIVGCLLVALIIALPAPPAFAQAAPRLETGVSARDVEVGRPFTVQLSAMVTVSNRVPDKPMLRTPPGIVIRSGPSVMTKTQVTLNGPNLVQQIGVVVSWTLEATRPGKYRIGPPSITWSGKRHAGALIEITAHSAGSLRQPKRRDPFDLFDIFGLPKMPGIFDQPQDPFAEPLLPPTEPSLAMSSAPASVVFIRALLDKKTAVLGEQVTLSVYEYHQVSAIRKLEVHEPSAPDFLQQPVLDPSEEPGTQFADVGSSVWKVRLIRKIALFPLRSGDLTVEPMQITYAGRGLRGQVVRETLRQQVHVVEAPAEGRPVGYRSGDVGRFSLSAEVDPRTVEAGGAIAVRVKVEGSGNLPATLPTPSGKGIEWLEPEVSDNIDVVDGELRGERAFNYVVRLRTPGNVELGDIELPFYDPDRRGYDVARAHLGNVLVRENPNAAPEKPTRDRFASLGGPRMTLGEVPKRGSFVTDSLYYWIALFASPLAVALAGVGWSFGRRVKRSARAWRDSLDRHAKVALKEARDALTEGKTADAAAAMERAIHAAVESATGLKSRGILRGDLRDALIDAGVDEASAANAVELLAATESLRFDPSADGQRVEALLDDARGLIRVLGKARKSGK